MSVFGQRANFDFGDSLEIPLALTLREDGDSYRLVRDSNGKELIMNKPVTRIQLVTRINVFLVDIWRDSGRSGQPEQVA